jgi:serine/threonine-protein kinase
MDESRWQQIQQIFEQAVELPRSTQPSAVATLCGGDEALQAEVLQMLEADARADPLLDSGLDHAAFAVLDFGALPSLVEQQIGPYRLIKLLGEGGMGIVYLAERTDIGGQVAIKLLRDAWFSPMRRERFRTEQLTLAQLNHPAIARIYDSNTLEDGTPWFVMEYADGLPLNEYWAKFKMERAGTLRDCLRLIRRVAEAVQYAHSHAIIHRDLKPSNILVIETGEVKLLDFGIAKQLNAEESQPNRTVTGLRMMTLAYASPEQLAGSAVGVYTDIYALGVLLFELITGQLPQPALASGAIATRDEVERPSAVIRRSRPELWATLRSQFTRSEWADLDALTLKALEPDSQRRYRTADALIRDLDALLEGRPLEAQPPSLGYTVGKFIRRNRRALLGVATAVLLIAATIAFYTVRLERSKNAALREAARTRAIQQFTESLFDGGNESAGPSAELKVTELLDRGRQEAAGLSNDPEMQSDMQETLGGIYQKLGKFDLAEPLLVSALTAREKLFGQQSPQYAESLISLGLLRKDQAQLKEAERLTRQAVAISQSLRPASRPATAHALVALGSVLKVAAKYDQAQQALESALKLQPQNAAATAATGENLTELGEVYFYQGKYSLSEQINKQALAIDSRLFGDSNPNSAQALNNLGSIEMNRANYRASENYYRRALAITQAWYGSDHPQTTANLTSLAEPLTMDNQIPEAQSLLERALAIQTRTNGQVNATVATTENQLGIVATQAKKYDEATRYFTQARDTWERLYGDAYPSIAVADSNLGSICMAQKDLPCAERQFRLAVERLRKYAPNTLNDAVAHVKLGRTLLREGRFADAEPETLRGYQFLVKNVSPNDQFLAGARKDLAADYDALHKPNLAARFRAEADAAQNAAK